MATDKEIMEITRTIFNTVECTNVTLFDGRGFPICPLFSGLTEDQKQTAYSGMKTRIEKEGLRNYIERKRIAWGTRATENVVESLLASNLLT